jgi:hypothetical protein
MRIKKAKCDTFQEFWHKKTQFPHKSGLWRRGRLNTGGLFKVCSQLVHPRLDAKAVRKRVSGMSIHTQRPIPTIRFTQCPRVTDFLQHLFQQPLDEQQVPRGIHILALLIDLKGSRQDAWVRLRTSQSIIRESASLQADLEEPLRVIRWQRHQLPSENRPEISQLQLRLRHTFISHLNQYSLCHGFILSVYWCDKRALSKKRICKMHHTYLLESRNVGS